MKQSRSPDQIHDDSIGLTRKYLLFLYAAFSHEALALFCKQLMYPSLKMTGVHKWLNLFSTQM